MLIEDLLGKNSPLASHERYMLKVNCAQFIEESDGCPLFKLLPASYQNFKRVKARLQKRTNELTEVYNKAFNHNNIRQRAVFAYASVPSLHEDMDTFYVFPVNGYKYLYCKEVTDSNSDYKRVVDTLFEQFNDTVKATEIITDLLKYTYLTEHLHDGIVAKAEIILYNIPQYYAVRVNPNQEYSEILSLITK
jgi:hypothetical protein